ncbi:carbon-nitrogen hydrolase family protein [Cognatishimia activa]|uniref:carbon-nitrogen hydrolase family protein n=1 Tax=Cognatishimia activa TaxID=1715691 RepID=UPI00222F7358|nr:carbon-nitrogen hydrolase family protein [Cognatishimia activa]UZD90680.1 carbon-nitrogen hydrolase family protein [Cognatishimia activa]
MKTALLQITSSDDPAENLAVVTKMLEQAKDQGAGYVLTPEVTNCVSGSRTHQNEVLRPEAEDSFLKGIQDVAARLGLWVTIGSLALKSNDPDGRFVNRQFLIAPSGEIKARYDKIHMFDVTVSETETYHESKGYRPGETAVAAETPFAKIGLSICYDIRFPHLHRALAKAGAEVLTIPSAFSTVTGAAHWHPLLQARAIETGCWVLAPAQTGTHRASRGPTRKTYGRSLIVSPWGEVMADAGTESGMIFIDLDREKVAEARRRIPSLTHDKDFDGPERK